MPLQSRAEKPPQGAKESSHGRKPVDKKAPKIQEAPAGGDAHAWTRYRQD